MRTFLSVCTLASFSFILFTSCQKEITGSSPTVADDSTFIQKIVWLDTSLLPGQDTVYYNFYEYDAQKRVSRITITTYDINNTRYVDYYNFSYNGQDTLPYRYSTTQLSSSDSVMSYLKYSNGFVILDSSRYYNNGTLDNIYWYRFDNTGGGKFVYTSRYESTAAPGIILTDDSVRYSRVVNNGNILSYSDSSWFNGIFLTNETGQITFDNKKSPFAKQAFWCQGYYGKQLDFSKLEGTNNLLSISFSKLSNPPETDTYTYEYNIEDYPAVARISSSNSTDFNKILYIYTHL